jgi:hypothetical protein
LTLRGFLDAAYALAVDELSQQGVSRGEVIAKLEENLSEPLADEVSGAEWENQRRRRIAEENRAATERLQALMRTRTSDTPVSPFGGD